MDGPSGASIDRLCDHLGRRWEAIDNARKLAIRERERVSSIIADNLLEPSDTSFVVFGSLARFEFTHGSDIDWTLLVDGEADPGHHRVAQLIRTHFKEKPPGPTETFGSLTFSHDIIHDIGGEADTNRNTTRRILLLLESAAIGKPEAYDRVVKNVLNRYLDEDISFLSRSGQRYKVPRFLLNDIVRYWRTMCVDYAQKYRERQGEKWALKNAKLRLSRKLIFVSGLLTCFNCYLKPPPGIESLFELPVRLEPLLDHLRSFVRMTPLEILADGLVSFAKKETAEKIFNAYDRFVAMLSDTTIRTHLESLKATEAQSDRHFKEIRNLSNSFQEGLASFFFEDNEKVSELTKKYGLF